MKDWKSADKVLTPLLQSYIIMWADSSHSANDRLRKRREYDYKKKQVYQYASPADGTCMSDFHLQSFSDLILHIIEK